MLLESRIARALRVCPKGALACLPLGMALNQSFIGAEVACRLCRALIKSDNTCRIIPISVPCGDNTGRYRNSPPAKSFFGGGTVTTITSGMGVEYRWYASAAPSPLGDI